MRWQRVRDEGRKGEKEGGKTSGVMTPGCLQEKEYLSRRSGTTAHSQEWTGRVSVGPVLICDPKSQAHPGVWLLQTRNPTQLWCCGALIPTRTSEGSKAE